MVGESIGGYDGRPVVMPTVFEQNGGAPGEGDQTTTGQPGDDIELHIVKTQSSSGQPPLERMGEELRTLYEGLRSVGRQAVEGFPLVVNTGSAGWSDVIVLSESVPGADADPALADPPGTTDA